MRQVSRFVLAFVVAVAGTAVLVAQDDALTAKARGIHERVMTLDTHNDINPGNFTAQCNYTMDLGNQVNLPKMFKGGLDASFFIVYVGQSTGEDAFTPAGYDRAYKSAIEKFDAIHRLTEQIAPDKIGLALTAADARKIYASGRKVAFIGVENGYPIVRTSGTSRSSTIAARATCRWRTTATASCPTRTPASATAGSGTGCRRSASRRSPR
jgi:membrane dipeptidase